MLWCGPMLHTDALVQWFLAALALQNAKTGWNQGL